MIPLASGAARADRIPVLSLGGAMDMHFHGHTWDYAANKDEDPTVFGDARLTLAFEDRPMPYTPRGVAAAQGRLVPEPNSRSASTSCSSARPGSAGKVRR